MADEPRKAGKHGCTTPTKSGRPCDAATLTDRDVCLAHADPETRAKAGFVALNGKNDLGGRPKIPKPMDLARQLVERHVVALLRPNFKALGLMLHDDGSASSLATGAVVVHQGEATDIEDLTEQRAAARDLFDRVYGKPRQQTELTGADGGPIQVAHEARRRAEEMSREELDGFLLGAETAGGMRERGEVE